MSNYLDKTELALHLDHFKAGNTTPEFVGMIGDLVTGVVRRYGIGLDRDDLHQEVWVLLIRKRDVIVSEGNPFSYLTTCVVNLCRMEHAKPQHASPFSSGFSNGFGFGGKEINANELVADSKPVPTCYLPVEKPPAPRPRAPLFLFGNKRRTLWAWSQRLGINYHTLRLRAKRGITAPELFKPTGTTLKQRAKECGLSYATVMKRRRSGWSDDRLFDPVRVLDCSHAPG